MRGEIDYDFIFAFVIFISLYMTVFNVMPLFAMSSQEEPDFLLMESKHLSEVLVKSPGTPNSWSNVTTMTSLGLAYFDQTYKPNVLDYNKLRQINGTDCSALMNKTRLTVNFTINVVTDYYVMNCTAVPPADARLVERMITVYNGIDYKVGKLQLYVWR